MTSNVFFDVDTGEVLENITSVKSLSYINYYVINKERDIKIDKKNGYIKWSYGCRKSGQRKLRFDELL